MFGEGVSNQEVIDAAKKRIEDYEEAYNKAACFLVESICGSQLLSVTTVLDDPIGTWNKLQQKFAKKSGMGQSVAQKFLLHFQHLETETTEENISRFEAVVEKCIQQGVTMDEQLLERQILD